MKYITTFFISLLGLSIVFAKQDVTFSSGAIKLSGTLFTPKGDGPFPAVVFVHGSGSETRKNSFYSAKWLEKLGYVVLTYDKRGVGESDGDPKSVNRFSFDDLANDAVAAVDYLSGLDHVEKNKIGLHATSQGGWVATLAASKTDDISYMIMRSASVCSVAEDRVFERSARLIDEGFSKQDVRESENIQKFEPMPSSSKTDSFPILFDEYKNEPWFERVYPGEDPNTQGLINYRTWYATIADFDPIPYLSNLNIPVFWIFGDPEIDRLGPIELSIDNLRKIPSADFEILQLDGEGHNIKEKMYERKLYDWLCDVNDYNEYKFKKH